MADDFLHHIERSVQGACRDCHGFDCEECLTDNFVKFGEAAAVAMENARQRMEESRRVR